MRVAVGLAAAAVLASCAPAAPLSGPEAACAARADEDPAVRETRLKATEPYWLWQNEGKLKIVRQQAIARCLQGRGGAARGGVEPPR